MYVVVLAFFTGAISCIKNLLIWDCFVATKTSVLIYDSLLTVNAEIAFLMNQL